VLTPAALPELYGAFLGELARVLRPTGRAVLLAGCEALLREAMPPSLRAAASIGLSLRGLTPVVCLFEKHAEGGT
jgi:hypothetical protein